MWGILRINVLYNILNIGSPMTKVEIEHILKRMPQVERAIRKHQTVACFYVGNRREVIEITKNIYLIRAIVEDIIQKEDHYIGLIVEYHIKQGKSDRYIITQLPLSKNSYYRLKQRIHEKIYNCCIEKGVVSYEEIFVDIIV